VLEFLKNDDVQKCGCLLENDFLEMAALLLLVKKNKIKINELCENLLLYYLVPGRDGSLKPEPINIIITTLGVKVNVCGVRAFSYMLSV
jgi:hypothetical protein